VWRALRANEVDGEVVMNNSWYWLWRHNPGALKLWDAPDFWVHSAFVRTAGAATTNQIRAHLRSLNM